MSIRVLSFSQQKTRNPALGHNGTSMPETTRFDGPSPLKDPSGQNKLAANSHTPLPNPGFSN